MGTDNKLTSRVITLAIVIIVVMLVILVIINSKNSKESTDSVSNIIKKSSIEKAVSSAPFDVIVTDKIIELTGDGEASIVNGAMFIIENKGITYKAAPFVDVKADVLGIYDKTLEEKEFYSIDEKLSTSYIRYRKFYKATALNWVTNQTMYGIWLPENKSLEDMVSIIDIELANYDENEVRDLSVYDIEEIDIDNIEFENYHSESLGVSFDMPVVESNVAVRLIDNYITVTYDFKQAFIIALNSNIKMEAIKEYTIRDLGNGYSLQYFSENQYSTYDKAYLDYEIFLKSTDRIVESFIIDNEN